MRWVRRIGLAVLVLLAIAIAVGQRFGDASLDPHDGEATVTLQVVDYGLHAALFVPREALHDAAERLGASRVIAVTDRFRAYESVEFGWGDEAFYRSVPTIFDLPVGLAIRAGLGLDDGTVLLVVGHGVAADAPFPGNGRAVVTLSERAFDRMVRLIEATLAGITMPEALGPGLYGPSLFYRATGHYSVLNVCNHWIARLMIAAGRPINLTLSIVSPLLIWQLR